MKYRNLLIAGLATLVATASTTFAQEDTAQFEQLDQLRNQTETMLVAQNAQADQVRKAMDDARTASAQAARTITKSADGKTYSTRLQSIIRRASAPSRVLVIPKDAGDAKGIAEVEEDLNVMSHILDKAASGDGDKSARAMGIVVPPRPPGSAAGPQNLFIEGYGALFFLNVNCPLLPPPAKENEPDAKEKTSNEWEEARQEMSQPQRYGSSGGGGGGFGGGGGEFNFAGVFPPGGNAPQYDADRVEELRKDLIAALKNAAHIRKLKSDETVTVVISAPGPSAGAKTKVRTSGGDNRPEEFQVAMENYQVAMDVFQNTGWTATGGPSSKLLLRARKSDAEAFQKGNLSFEEFRKKVTVILY